MTTAHPRRAGFWLVELLFVLGLLAIVALAAGKLFHASFHLSYDTAEAQNRAATLEALTTALRSDMWSATKCDVIEGQTVKLALPDDRTIVWSIAGETLTRRENDGPLRRWAIPKETTFAADDAVLVLRLPFNQTSMEGEARFASQVQLIARLGS